MGVLLKIAIRNLKEHKIKTLIIGTIIAMGIMILVVGNSMLDTATKGLRKNYWDNYTGHIIISGSDDELTIFGRMIMQGMNKPVPIIPEYHNIMDYISSHPDVDCVNPQISGRAILSPSEGDGRVVLMLFGIDPEIYRFMFPENLNIIEGSFIKPGEEGILISETTKLRLDEASGQELHAGDKILITGVNTVSGTKMRAIGARKSFIRKMIVIETLTISWLFGLVGIVISGIILWVLNMKGITAPNFYFEVLFGGKHLHPVLSAGAVGWSFLVIAFIGVISSLYPVSAGILMVLISIFLDNGRLNFVLVPADMGLNILILSLLSLFAAWFPAKKASGLEPALALRTQY